MTRKDYKIIAEAIRQTREYFVDNYKNGETQDTLITLGLNTVVRNLQVALKADNPRFSSEVFREACGL